MLLTSYHGLAVAQLQVWEATGTLQNNSIGDKRWLTVHSIEKFDLVQLRNDKPWKFVSESSVTLSGAHGSEIVRSFCFLDKVYRI